MVNKVIYWFSLETAVYGSGIVKREIVLFSGVVLGTIGQWVFTVVNSGRLEWKSLLLGLIASIVTFPFIYYNAGLNKSKMSLVKWCVAFQNGFFWPALLQQVGQTFHSP